MKTKPLCAVCKNSDVEKAVFQVLSLIKLPDLTGKKVLLKPNVGRNVETRTGVDTNPAVTIAVFNYLKEQFNAEYFIGDSPIMGVKTREAFRNSGHGSFFDRKDITFLDLDDIKPLTLPIKNGRVIKKVKVTGYFHDFDYIISIPVLKMHMHTGASLSYKNMKGMLYKREKVKLHQLRQPEAKKKYNAKELDIAIADLAFVIKPDLVVCDGTWALEGMGPSAGTKKKLDIVLASTDFLAADLTALHLVKLDISHTPHLKLIAEQTGGVASINEIKTIPENLDDLRVDFEVPPTEIKIADNKVNLLDAGSCSACQSSVYLFLKNNTALITEYFDNTGHFNIAIGSDVKEVPKDTFLIGNCTAMHKDKGSFLVGCPPSQTIVKERVRKQLTKIIEGKETKH